MKFPKTITVACFHLNQLFEIPDDDDDENAKPGGIDGLLLDTLAQALKFEYKLVRAPENYWGKLISRNNWTGMIGVISRDEADIGLGLTSIMEQRKEVVDFSTPYTENIFTFATHFPKMLPYSTVYFSPFDVYTWVGYTIHFCQCLYTRNQLMIFKTVRSSFSGEYKCLAPKGATCIYPSRKQYSSSRLSSEEVGKFWYVEIKDYLKDNFDEPTAVLE
ncbi:uncharacterized protein TNCV_3003561 [Trichonephila clavipes]|nr:uncharacterized protein TNCV_3003561 [Trichonephila clavipes]